MLDSITDNFTTACSCYYMVYIFIRLQIKHIADIKAPYTDL